MRTQVGAVLGLGGIPTIQAPRSKAKSPKPYRGNAAQTKPRSNRNQKICDSHQLRYLDQIQIRVPHIHRANRSGGSSAQNRPFNDRPVAGL